MFSSYCNSTVSFEYLIILTILSQARFKSCHCTVCSKVYQGNNNEASQNRVTGPLQGEYIGQQGISFTKGQ